MLRKFIASHGKLAEGFISSLAVSFGKDDIEFFNAYVNEDQLTERLEAFYKNVKEGDTVLLISDIYGGSVNTEMSQYSMRDDTLLVTGVNLAFILDISLRKDINKQELNELIEKSRDNMRMIDLSTLDFKCEDNCF